MSLITESRNGGKMMVPFTGADGCWFCSFCCVFPKLSSVRCPAQTAKLRSRGVVSAVCQPMATTLFREVNESVGAPAGAICWCRLGDSHSKDVKLRQHCLFDYKELQARLGVCVCARTHTSACYCFGMQDQCVCVFESIKHSSWLCPSDAIIASKPRQLSVCVSKTVNTSCSLESKSLFIHK